MESEAVKAVEMAAERVKVIVRGKQAIRGDSWMEMRGLTMADLVLNKGRRVLRLYEHPKNVTELEEELADIIAYSAFQLYLIEKGKT